MTKGIRPRLPERLRAIMTRTGLAFIVTLVSCSGAGDYSAVSSDEVKEALAELDKVIDRKSEIENRKDRSIDAIRERLGTADTDTAEYRILDRIYSEYYQYDIDSAVFYAKKKLAVAHRTGIGRLITDATFDLADRYALSGMYTEVLEIMAPFDIGRLESNMIPPYYHIYDTVFGGLESSSDDPVLSNEYKQEKDRYRSALLNTLSGNDISRIYVETEIMRDEGRGMEIRERLEPMLASDTLTVHQRGIIYYILARACQLCGDNGKAILYMALSARYDLETPVKEYKSLYELAVMLYEAGDIRRAYRYITRSVNDAIAANAAINIQSIYAILPVISGSYNREMARNHRQLVYCLIGVCLLSAALAIAIFFTIKGNIKRSQANAKLKEYVNLLKESNNIKESYIGRYIDMCSHYIGGLERYRSQLRKSARTGGFAEVSEKLKSNEFIDRELDNFYAQFDATFLDLFPDFVEQLNALLQPDRQIECKSKDGILTTELRVVALIRLGVTDSVKIAEFLRRSVSTIYNYRVKLRNSALSGREEFESRIMKIGMIE